MQREDRHVDRRPGMADLAPRAADRPSSRRPRLRRTKAEPSSRQKDGTSSQKLMLFMRGNAMSGAPIISGTNQLPKPPISAGITRKNTMIRPWAVMMTL